MALLNFKTISRKNADKLAITLEQAKAHCFLVEDDHTQDAILTDFILTAQSILENDNAMPYCFSQGTYSATFSIEKDRVLLPKCPVISIDKIEEKTGNDFKEISLDEATLEQGDNYDFAVLKNYTRGQDRTLRITFTAGNDNVRLDLKQAVAQLVAHLYEYRGMTTTQQLYDNSVYKLIIGRLKRLSI